jgi:hypothetical protein
MAIHETPRDAPSRPSPLRDEAAAALAARRELGEELEPAIVDSFLERVEDAIDARVEQRLAEHDRERGVDKTTVTIALGSIALAIPLTGAAAGLPDSASWMAVMGTWIAIVLVNAAYAFGRR